MARRRGVLCGDRGQQPAPGQQPPRPRPLGLTARKGCLSTLRCRASRLLAPSPNREAASAGQRCAILGRDFAAGRGAPSTLPATAADVDARFFAFLPDPPGACSGSFRVTVARGLRMNSAGRAGRKGHTSMSSQSVCTQPEPEQQGPPPASVHAPLHASAGIDQRPPTPGSVAPGRTAPRAAQHSAARAEQASGGEGAPHPPCPGAPPPRPLCWR